jgi:hypothetical protein
MGRRQRLDENVLCECHCEAKYHEQVNQYKYGKCWTCYGDWVGGPRCYEFRQHKDIVNGKEV